MHRFTASFFPVLTALLCFALPSGLLAQDSTSAVPDSGVSAADSSVAPADSAALAGDSSAAATDSLAGRKADSAMVKAGLLDSLAGRAGTDSTKARTIPALRSGNALEVLVIPWDWDDFTNVTEVALKDSLGHEFSLTKNEEYGKIFKLLGQKIKVKGRIMQDADGFYSITVSSLEDSTAAKKTVQAP